MKNAAAIASALLLAAGAAQAQTQTDDKYRITPEEQSACEGDAGMLCASAYPDEDRLVACMRENRAKLSPTCLAAFSKGLRRRHMM